MRKLSQDQLEALSLITSDRDAVNAFLYALESAVLHLEADVVRNPIVLGKENEVIYKKIRAEGGRKILEEAHTLLSPKTRDKIKPNRP